MSEKIVIVGYKPLPGKQSDLLELSKKHWEILNNEGLVSERKPIIAQSADGSIIEIFGWKSKDAMQDAHTNEVVLGMWEKYNEVCEYIPAGEVEEFSKLFSEFNPIN